MTTEVNINRQSVLCAIRDVTYDDFTSGVAKVLIYLRPGTKILRGYLDVTTAWNAAGAVTATIGDTEGTDDVDRYIATGSAVNMKAAAITTFSGVTNGVIETAEALTMTITVASGTNTQGAARVCIEYSEDSRSTEFNAFLG